MKKLVSIIVLTALLLCTATALAATRIAIVQPMSHTSLNQIRDTIVSELNAAGRDVEMQVPPLCGRVRGFAEGLTE